MKFGKCLPNLTCVVIYALKKKCVPEDGFRDSCSENFMFAG